MKKWAVVIFTMILMVWLIPGAMAQTDSGERAGIAWTYDNGVLTLKGEGTLRFDDSWSKYRKK